MEYSNVLLGICIFVQVITKTGHSIQEAADLLNKGQLVAIPTETVYGLAANGLDQDAISEIFKVKRRPLSNPLILHFKDLNSVSKYVSNIPAEAKKIAEEFWPGPLTLLLEKTAKIPNSVNSGKQKIAVRIPNHPDTLKLLKPSRHSKTFGVARLPFSSSKRKFIRPSQSYEGSTCIQAALWFNTLYFRWRNVFKRDRVNHFRI